MYPQQHNDHMSTASLQIYNHSAEDFDARTHMYVSLHVDTSEIVRAKIERPSYLMKSWKMHIVLTS